MRVFPNIAATVKVRKRLRIASGSQPPSGSVPINLHENNVTLSTAPRSSAISSSRLPASAEDVPIKERSISGADIIL
jgi:hypothetical protein